MSHPQYKNLVGYVVGTIMPHSPSLLIAIYALPDDRHTMSVTSGRHHRTNFRNVTILARTYKDVLQSVWANNRVPCWYYLQFDDEHDTDKLYDFALPVQVFGPWHQAEIGS